MSESWLLNQLALILNNPFFVRDLIFLIVFKQKVFKTFFQASKKLYFKYLSLAISRSLSIANTRYLTNSGSNNSTFFRWKKYENSRELTVKMRILIGSNLGLVIGTIYTPWSDWIPGNGAKVCEEVGFENRHRECLTGW